MAAAVEALSATFAEDRREFSARLQTLIAAQGELRERSASKHLGLVAATGAALEKRGVPELTAGLAAELGLRAFDRGFAQWADPANHQPLTELTGQALRELQAATTALLPPRG